MLGEYVKTAIVYKYTDVGLSGLRFEDSHHVPRRATLVSCIDRWFGTFGRS
jgi:hypothetical protein